jgi:hypothetical protein
VIVRLTASAGSRTDVSLIAVALIADDHGSFCVRGNATHVIYKRGAVT